MSINNSGVVKLFFLTSVTAIKAIKQINQVRDKMSLVEGLSLGPINFCTYLKLKKLIK